MIFKFLIVDEITKGRSMDKKGEIGSEPGRKGDTCKRPVNKKKHPVTEWETPGSRLRRLFPEGG